MGKFMIVSQTRQADWRRANPLKYNAHLAVQRAVVAGELENSAVKSVASKLSMRITTNTMNLCRCAGCAGGTTLGFTIMVRTCFRFERINHMAIKQSVGENNYINKNR
jgi:hypothetical protein